MPPHTPDDQVQAPAAGSSTRQKDSAPEKSIKSGKYGEKYIKVPDNPDGEEHHGEYGLAYTLEVFVRLFCKPTENPQNSEKT
jgi:hypothetical protein